MIVITPKYYKDFRCIAGACPDSCCQGWEVDADEESLAYYETLSDELEIKQRIDSVLDKDEFGNTIFRLAPKKRCPFLNDENLCDMHIAIGGEHTPITCRNFPRFIYDFGGTREIGISFSCPVAADMIYNSEESLSFDTEINSDLPTLNDIDAELFIKLKQARNQAFSILQNPERPLDKRLSELLSLAVKLQKDIDDYSDGGLNISFEEVFNNPELINPEWQEKLKNMKPKSIENSLYNENIAAYFIYKYLLLAVYDRDVLSKVKMTIVGVLINTYMGEGAWTMHLWSKETEHSQYNMDRYKKLLKEADCLTAENLYKLIRL